MPFGYLELGGSTMWIQLAVATLVSVPLVFRDRINRAKTKVREWQSRRRGSE